MKAKSEEVERSARLEQLEAMEDLNGQANDSDLPAQDYAANNYWRQEADQFDLDELLGEIEEPDSEDFNKREEST